MKRQMTVLIILLVSFLLITVSASAMSPDEIAGALKEAETFDRQLEILCDAAEEYAETLELGGWDISLEADAAPGLPEGLIPDSWVDFETENTDTFPEELRGHKFIALYSFSKENLYQAGWLLARMPADMRARSLEEAEYAIVLRNYLTPSGYTYIPPASSSHRDYAAYVFDLKNGGKPVRVWFHRNYAKRSGRIGSLNGDTMGYSAIWQELRSKIWGETRVELADNAALVFSFTGKYAYLKRYAGEITEVEIPDEIDGHPVIEIAGNCFANCSTLESIRLPEGLKTIGISAFEYCESLDDVTLPSSLETIQSSAFSGCKSLARITLPEGLKTLGKNAFSNADALTEITLPGSLTSVGESAFSNCSKLARVVVSEGVRKLQVSVFSSCDQLACVYLPASMDNPTGLESITERAVIYAPEGSEALKWANEKQYNISVSGGVGCSSPEEMPAVNYITEGDFEFQLFDGKAALSKYLGNSESVMIPDTADGIPVSALLYGAVYQQKKVTSVTLPASVTKVWPFAVKSGSGVKSLDVYIRNPDCQIEKNGLYRYSSSDYYITVHAPEGSAVQRFVTDTNEEWLKFEPWGKGVKPDEASLANALDMAEKVQQSVTEFWDSCDQEEYGWLNWIPSYDIREPRLAAVLRFTQEQYDSAAQLLGGPENTVKTYAVFANTQWNLPYARAAVQTAQQGLFGPAADGSAALVVLAYRTDLILVSLQQDGTAHAALLFCSPPEILSLTSERILSLAAQYGITGECTMYDQEIFKTLNAK